MSHSTTIITFDKPDKTYLPGDTVNGQVTIINTKPLKTRSVFIKWIGYSKTSIRRNPVCQHNYVNGSKLAWVSKSDKNEMPVGTHEYSFSFTLPKDCAPTLKRSNGQNEYKVTVEFDKPWWFNTKVEEEFRVTNEIDNIAQYRLNRSVELIIPSLWYFARGPISVKTTVPCDACQIGETFDVTFDIANNSRTVIKGIQLRLISRTHWHASHQQKPCEEFGNCHLSTSQQKYSREVYDASEMHQTNLAPYSEGTFTFPFTIPEYIQTPSFKSGLMTHGYLLSAEICLEGFSIVRCRVLTQILVAEKLDGKKNGKKEETLNTAPPPYTV